MHESLPASEPVEDVTSETEWRERLCSGDEAAWAALHEAHYPRLWSSVNRILNNPSHTDDIVQEAFVKAHREIGRFQGQSRLGTWLYRIAVNQTLDFLRKQQRLDRWLSFFSPLRDKDDDTGSSNVVPEGAVEPTVTAGLHNAELRETIAAAIAELSPEHRAVVQLRLIDEMSLEETATLLRCKPGTVNSRLHYACEHLRRKLRHAVASA
ncbi:hypothetical protein DB346_18360 [Verrucomicrobia bacterium LW23]|nr:hypothetical protein DB346_18360 [Verrucomicrobia bacterium LW23]